MFKTSRLGNYPNSLLVYVYVRKTLTHYKGFFGWSKSILGFVLNWFCFGRKFSVKKWQKCPIYVSSPTPLRPGKGLHA